jgi:hypothetical protein
MIFARAMGLRWRSRDGELFNKRDAATIASTFERFGLPDRLD